MSLPLKPMKYVDRAELDILLIHLVRSPEVAMLALPKLQVDDFDDVTERGHKLIWAVSSEFFKQHRRPIPLAILSAELTQRMADAPQFSDQSIKLSTQQLAAFVFSGMAEKDFIVEYALSILSSFLYQRRVHAPLVDAMEKQAFGPEALRAAQAEELRTTISRSRVVTPFSGDVLLGATVRDDLGVAFLSQMMGGGARKGELYGFIAPSGGGKTTLANQIATSYAARARKIAVFSYEEAPTADYLVPVYAVAAQIKRARLEQIRDPRDLAPDELKRFREAQEIIGANLRYVDMSCTGTSRAGSGGVPELEAKLIELRNQGFEADAFILDWFLPMASRAMASAPLGPRMTKMREERTMYQTMIDELKQVASRNGCWGWVAHQTAPAEASKKRNSEWNDAAEFKSFAWYLNGCFTLNMLDANQIGNLKYSKARSQKTSVTSVQLKGEIATFVSLSGDFTYDQRLRQYIPTGRQNVVPSEHGNAVAAVPQVQPEQNLGSATEMESTMEPIGG